MLQPIIEHYVGLCGVFAMQHQITSIIPEVSPPYFLMLHTESRLHTTFQCYYADEKHTTSFLKVSLFTYMYIKYTFLGFLIIRCAT